MTRYLDDCDPGLVERFGHYPVTREEVLDFARRYDPQSFHLDDAAAARTPFGRVAASGWHTCAMTMRMMVEHWQSVGLQSLGSPGIDHIRWTRPVYPGDQLRVEAEWLEVRPSKSKPDLGIARVRYTTLNQDGVAVMQFEGITMLARRPGTAVPPLGGG